MSGMGSTPPANNGSQLPAEELPLTLDDVLKGPEFDGSESHAHSGRYLKERNPRLYESILLMRKYGIPVEVIASDINVSENTVRAVEFENFTTVEDSKKSILNNLRKFAHGATSIMAENAHLMDINKLPIAMGIAVEKLLLLEGQATHRVEHVVGPTVPSLEAEIRDLQAKFVQVRDVSAEESVRSGASELQKGSPRIGESMEQIIEADLTDDQDPRVECPNV